MSANLRRAPGHGPLTRQRPAAGAVLGAEGAQHGHDVTGVELGAGTRICGWAWNSDYFRKVLSEEGTPHHKAGGLLIHTRSYGATPLGTAWDLPADTVDPRKEENRRLARLYNVP